MLSAELKAEAEEAEAEAVEDSHMKGAAMLVVSLRGVNFRFWSRLACSGQNTILYLALKVSFTVAFE